MQASIAALRAINIVGYVALAAVVLHGWRRRRDRVSTWAAVAFGSLGLLELLALIPDHAGNLPERAAGRVEIALLALFPYLMFRFATAFRTDGRRLENALFAPTAALLAWTAALPSVPHSGESWSPEFRAYVSLFLVVWTAFSVLTAARLALAGRAQPTVARRRMHMLAFATATITAALFLAAASGAPHSRPELAAEAIALVALVAFFLGLSPPAIVRIWWRRPEQAHLQQALASLLTFASSQEEVAARVLGPAAAIVGARAIAIRNEKGAVVGSWNAARRGAGRDRARTSPRATRGRTRRSSTSTCRAAASSSGRHRTRRSSASRSSTSCGRSARSPGSRSTASASSRRSTRPGSSSSGRTSSRRASSRSPPTSCGRR